MCTVLYIPANDDTRYFVSLRDENPQRSKASVPTIITEEGINFLAPIDSFAKGTWAGVNEFGNIIILLNGGLENHQKKTTYRKSRGLIVRELLAKEMPIAEWSFLDMTDIEPFTLIVSSENKLFQLVWDGGQKHRIMLDANKPYCWSSSTLYNNEIKTLRDRLFQDWIKTKPEITKENISDFFNTFNDPNNGFFVHRSATLQTLSYSFIEIKKEKAHYIYTDLQTKKEYLQKIALHKMALCDISCI